MGMFNSDEDGYGGRDYAKYPLTTRERVKAFNLAFGRPVNTVPVTPSVSDRILLGKLLLEEAIETIELGLGLTIRLPEPEEAEGRIDYCAGEAISKDLRLVHDEGDFYDPVETADGTGDVNVVIHFIAHWLGYNLDKITAHIDDSNMSKLDVDGSAIINGITPGYLPPDECETELDADTTQYDPSKPIGKILKSDQFWDAKPGIPAILAEGNN